MPLCLGLGLAEQLVRFLASLGEQLVGVAARCRLQRASVLVCFPADVIGLLASPDGALLGGVCPALGFGDELLAGLARRLVHLVDLPLRILPARRQLLIELLVELGALRLRLAKDALRLTAHSVRVALG